MPDAVPHSFPFRVVERREVTRSGVRSVVLAASNGALRAGSGWPVTLVAEALAQSILLIEPPAPAGAPELRLVALNKVRLLREIGPGDRLEVEVVPEGTFGALHRFSCRAVCGGALAATAEVTVSAERGMTCN